MTGDSRPSVSDFSHRSLLPARMPVKASFVPSGESSCSIATIVGEVTGLPALRSRPVVALNGSNQTRTYSVLAVNAARLPPGEIATSPSEPGPVVNRSEAVICNVRGSTISFQRFLTPLTSRLAYTASPDGAHAKRGYPKFSTWCSISKPSFANSSFTAADLSDSIAELPSTETVQNVGRALPPLHSETLLPSGCQNTELGRT